MISYGRVRADGFEERTCLDMFISYAQVLKNHWLILRQFVCTLTISSANTGVADRGKHCDDMSVPTE